MTEIFCHFSFSSKLLLLASLSNFERRKVYQHYTHKLYYTQVLVLGNFCCNIFKAAHKSHFFLLLSSCLSGLAKLPVMNKYQCLLPFLFKFERLLKISINRSINQSNNQLINQLIKKSINFIICFGLHSLFWTVLSVFLVFSFK